ncbi:hypothetical protein NLJ89_g6276 [Agrocybe chaxingu]|uniref:Postreplication repair E3 ubiquitin-protein ligase RAD18 n=1 Tax=Agrocybe chaxingu TaxID=84603 RepID=A0A9W8MUT1_9AGAR|nr:hypothetical protein NLJ89_g6276 [Agrocybe chaxingu]
MNYLTADVQDETDFPPRDQAPGLRGLDASLRCDICGELYDAPVTIACGHCFCSACIRSSLALKQECPSCRTTAGEVHIRPNPILEKVISDWNDARPFILRLLKQDAERSAAVAAAAASSSEIADRDKGTSKKRKRTPDSSTSHFFDSNIAGPSRNPLSPKGKSIRPSSPPSRPKKLKPKSDEIIDMTIPSSDIEEDEMPAARSGSLVPKANDLVSCPICQKKVRYSKLNGHIDKGCKDPPQKAAASAASTWSKIMGASARNGHQKGKHKKKGNGHADDDSDEDYPLPISTYTTLKDRQLKEMLLEHDLPLTGDRTNWEQRHQRWVMLYNANLDRSNRKTKTELRRDLKKWEEDTAKKKKIVIHDVIGYQIEHKSEFTRLVDAARQSSKAKVPAASRSADAVAPASSSPPSPPKSSSSVTEFKPTGLLAQSSVAEVGDGIVVDTDGE